MARHVVLLGPMGSGKTSIGTRAATLLRRPLVDGDELLEARTGGRTAADVLRDEGVDELHRLETEIALGALAARRRAVIGPAASVIESAEVRDELGAHVVVLFTAPAEYLAERARRKTHRPFLDDPDLEGLLRRQLAIREPLARPLAALVIDVTRVSKPAAARAIASVAGRRR